MSETRCNSVSHPEGLHPGSLCAKEIDHAGCHQLGDYYWADVPSGWVASVVEMVQVGHEPAEPIEVAPGEYARAEPEVSEKDDADGEPCADCGVAILNHVTTNHRWRSAEAAEPAVEEYVLHLSPAMRQFLMFALENWISEGLNQGEAVSLLHSLKGGT